MTAPYQGPVRFPTGILAYYSFRHMATSEGGTRMGQIDMWLRTEQVDAPWAGQRVSANTALNQENLDMLAMQLLERLQG